MKLLLTSGGITNESLAKKLNELIGNKVKIAFIPTAANIDAEDKGWLIDNLNQFRALGEIDIIDIAALEKRIWLPRLQYANVIVVGGGNTEYLTKMIEQSGFKEELTELLKERVYIGISAGSIVASRTIWATYPDLIKCDVNECHEGLHLVDFHLKPHLGSSYFPYNNKETIGKAAEANPQETIYLCDDETGIYVEDGKIEVISEGEWYKFN